MKLFSKYSNLCDHDNSTSRTERQKTCRSNTALCVALRGKNTIRQKLILQRFMMWLRQMAQLSITVSVQTTTVLTLYSTHSAAHPMIPLWDVPCIDLISSLGVSMRVLTFRVSCIKSHRMQNAAARIVCQAPRSQHHSVDLLKDLH